MLYVPIVFKYHQIETDSSAKLRVHREATARAERERAIARERDRVQLARIQAENGWQEEHASRETHLVHAERIVQESDRVTRRYNAAQDRLIRRRVSIHAFEIFNREADHVCVACVALEGAKGTRSEKLRKGTEYFTATGCRNISWRGQGEKSKLPKERI